MHKGGLWMESGSYREGFRFRSSDRDTMLWPSFIKIITDISQSRFYNASKFAVVLMEDYDISPGFVRLRLLTQPRNNTMKSWLVPFNGNVYISSFVWRESHFQCHRNGRCLQQTNITIHGPCTSGFQRSIQFDHLLCLVTMYWPKLMRSWVDRCLRHTWPSMPELEKILSNGCHCVPIGSQTGSTSNEIEWRLSFSQAEKQLVFTMNHTQFLCYGLLKIFLKQVINYRSEQLLCSYYVKTTMFWIIQLGHVKWYPNNLLGCFWVCLKYLVHCVYRGVFPNFFISLNNLFKNKVVGCARDFLLQKLYQYYRMGLSCLLLSPTLRSILEKGLHSPNLVLSSAKTTLADIDMCGSTELFQSAFPAEHKLVSYLYLKRIETLSQLSISLSQLLTLQYCTAETLVRFAFMMLKNMSCCTHKNVYNLDRMICNMLKLAARVGPLSHLLYIALYYYKTGRYERTLHITCLTRQRLSQLFVMNFETVDRQSYNEALGNLSLSKRMTKAWVFVVRLFNDIPCIEEISLEQNIIQQNEEPVLHLSPFVMIEMLSVLSYYKLGNISQCVQSLTDFRTLLLYDDGAYVHCNTRDVSWHILGICQHVVGDLHGSLLSYRESLRQMPYHRIQEATDIRIGRVEQQLHRNR